MQWVGVCPTRTRLQNQNTNRHIEILLQYVIMCPRYWAIIACLHDITHHTQTGWSTDQTADSYKRFVCLHTCTDEGIWCESESCYSHLFKLHLVWCDFNYLLDTLWLCALIMSYNFLLLTQMRHLKLKCVVRPEKMTRVHCSFQKNIYIDWDSQEIL